MVKIGQEEDGSDGQREQRLSRVMEEVDNYFNDGEVNLFSGFAFRQIKEVAGDDKKIIDEAYRKACKIHGKGPADHLFGRPSDELVRSMQQFLKVPG